jgi:parvulin-like peptidyl-prolyl isomerase
MVNGVPVTEEEVRLKLARDSHESEVTQKRVDNTLDAIIRQELIRQRAVELGLDADPQYRARLRPAQAQLSAFERDQLEEAFFLREVLKKAEVDETTARKHFEDNAGLYRTERHLWQILHKGDEARAAQDLRDIESGTPFEEVAARRFPNLPRSAGRPWDLGFLKWPQVPEPWREVVLELKPGEVSGLIRGPRERFWVIKLIDTRENPDLTFESHKAAIIESLKAEAVDALRAKTEHDLRQRAEVEYTGNALTEPEQ